MSVPRYFSLFILVFSLLPYDLLEASETILSAETPVETKAISPEGELSADEYIEQFMLDAPDAELISFSAQPVLMRNGSILFQTWKGVIREGYLLRASGVESVLGEVGEEWTSFNLRVPLPNHADVLKFALVKKDSKELVAEYRLVTHFRKAPDNLVLSANPMLYAFVDSAPVTRFSSSQDARSIRLRVLGEANQNIKAWRIQWLEPNGAILFEERGEAKIPSAIDWPTAASRHLISGEHQYLLEIDGKTLASGKLIVEDGAKRIFEVKNFAVAGLVGLQSFGGAIVSGRIAWTPRLRFNDRYEAQSELSLSPLKERGSGSLFLSTEIVGGVGYRVYGPIFVSGLVGVHHWFISGEGIAPSMSARFSYRRTYGTLSGFLTRWLPIWDRIEFGYGVRLGNVTAHCFTLALGMQL